MVSEQSEAEKAAEEHAKGRYFTSSYDRDDFIDAFLAGAAWAAPQWVRCSERMPGDEEVLIVWKGVVCTGWYMEAGEWVGPYWDISGRTHPVTNPEEVTHWMNKPAAPEVEK